MKRIIQEYQQILATERKLKARQQERDNRHLDTEVWIVHDKDDGSVISAANTKTMAIKRACAVIEFPATRARKNSWLDLDKYSLQQFNVKRKEAAA